VIFECEATVSEDVTALAEQQRWLRGR